MICTQMIPAPTNRVAISYDPIRDELVFQLCEIIGLVQLDNPAEDDIQQVPCYLHCNEFGLFWVPELEYNFLRYVDPREVDMIDMSKFKPQIDEIKHIYKEAQLEVVEVETKGKVSTIKRTVRKLSDEPKNTDN